jgi:hypothetical protein
MNILKKYNYTYYFPYKIVVTLSYKSQMHLRYKYMYLRTGWVVVYMFVTIIQDDATRTSSNFIE